jgi:hypothetical protein
MTEKTVCIRLYPDEWWPVPIPTTNKDEVYGPPNTDVPLEALDRWKAAHAEFMAASWALCEIVGGEWLPLDHFDNDCWGTDD